MDIYTFKKDNFKGSNLTSLFQKYGKNVVRYGRSILTKRKRNTSNRTLYDSLSYDTHYDSIDDSYSVNINVGAGEDYWAFVESGVKGSESTKPNVGKNKEVLGLPSFSFKKKNIAKGVIKNWIAIKPIKLRDKAGKFISKSESNIKSASFLIGRAVATRGTSYSGFLSTPIMTQNKTLSKEIYEAYGKDLENYYDKELIIK